MAASSDPEPSYIDYEAFLSPNFSPHAFANTLITTTNDPSDTTLDLATPLSRVLFDIQEIDTHIHNLTSSSALPLITHTQEQVASAQRVLENVEAQVQALTEGYARLESDVVERYENAQEVRVAAENSLETLRLAKATGRYLMLGRQLEGQMGALSWSGRSTSGSGSPAGSPVPGSMGSREDHRALVDASYTLLQLRRLSSPIDENDEGYGLGRINVVRTLKTDLVTPAENTVKSKAQQIISRFSLASLSADAAAAAATATPQLGSATLSRSASPGPGGMTTFAQAEEARAKVASAISALYLLSPTPTGTAYIPVTDFQPELLLSSLKNYIQNTLTTSSSLLSRALSMLPHLDRALHEVSVRCLNVLALETLLESIKPPHHPFLTYASTAPDSEQESQGPTTTPTILSALYRSLDTPSLVTYFWRSLASSLNTRVQDILAHGGAAARALIVNRERLREDIRECVMRGSQLPRGSIVGGGAGERGEKGDRDRDRDRGSWEREAVVMVNAVVGPLTR